MTKHIFIGWDQRDELASRVAMRSIRAHAKDTDDLNFVLLKDFILRRAGYYWREYVVRPNGQMIDHIDGKPFSTGFSFTRFLVPELARSMKINEPVLFRDSDFMFRAPIEDLFDEWDNKFDVMCVQHEHTPREHEKMDGVEQTRYFRKNWSSMMLIHPERTHDCNLMNVNAKAGSWLHALMWAKEIGGLSPDWNHLVGYDKPNENARGVHFTLGTPDMLLVNEQEQEHGAEWWKYVDAGELETVPFIDVVARELAKQKREGV